MNRIIEFSVICLFFFYWAVTLFFNLPENYLTIKLSKQNTTFQTFLFQRWGFFAPPPTFDDRLYYVFHKKGDSTLRNIQPVEICKNLFKEKSRKAPFNNDEDIFDYIISNSLITIADEAVRFRNLKTYSKQNQSNLISVLNSDSLFNLFFWNYIKSTESFKSLLNYSNVIAKANPLLGAVDSVEIWILRKNIPQFSYRDSIFKNNIDVVIFKSKKLNIPQEYANKN